MSKKQTVHVLSEIASSGAVNGMKILASRRPDVEFKEIKYNNNGLESDSDRDEIQRATVLLAEVHLVAKFNLTQNLPNLKWLQSTFAGVDYIIKSLDKNKPTPEYQLTRFAAGLGEMMAEYVLGHIIARERNFQLMATRQKQKIWSRDTVGVYRHLSDLRLGIIGCGTIGSDIAKAASCLGMSVWGLGRRDLPTAQRPKCVDKYMLLKDLPLLLEGCDYVCNVLPSTPATRWLLSGNVLSRCQAKKSVFINIGRGDIIDEPSLIKAISSGWISHAICDVFDEEPLSDSSALWCHPDVTVTPHVATRLFPEEVCDLFLENLDLYMAGKPLKYTVNFNQGY